MIQRYRGIQGDKVEYRIQRDTDYRCTGGYRGDTEVHGDTGYRGIQRVVIIYFYISRLKRF